MGTEQSSARDRAGSSGNSSRLVKTCYYDLLGVDRQASDDEIKKTYRRKALELHPDRNFSDVENATRKFAEIQSAYEVLSDPQERAWYDSHRDAILHSDDLGEEYYEHNVRLTSSAEIINLISKFTKSVPYTDNPDGFYGGLGITFSTLAREEVAASDREDLERVEYPEFGNARDSYEETVRPFYAAWLGFSTKKKFAWMDEYKTAEAHDRRVRRLMEKENKRLREEGIREFNDAVRSLVAFVRNRDPRYMPNSQSEVDRQKLLRKATAAQAARSRAANQARFDDDVVPDWAKSQVTEDGTSPELEVSEDELYECVICGKIFKSEKQYEMHENSKKHIKAVQQLKRQMQKENKLFSLDCDGFSSAEAAVRPKAEDSVSTSSRNDASTKVEISASALASGNDDSSESVAVPHTDYSNEITDFQAEDSMNKDTGDVANGSSTSEDDLGDVYASRQDIESRLSILKVATTLTTGDRDTIQAGDKRYSIDRSPLIANDRDSQASHNPDKAKARRAKKATRNDAVVQIEPYLQCLACGEKFASKTKLFRHIKEYSHAQPVSTSTSRTQGKGQ